MLHAHWPNKAEVFAWSQIFWASCLLSGFQGNFKLFDRVFSSFNCWRKGKSSFFGSWCVHFWWFVLLLPIEYAASCMFVRRLNLDELVDWLKFALRLRRSLGFRGNICFDLLLKLLLEVPKWFSSHIFCMFLNRFLILMRFQWILMFLWLNNRIDFFWRKTMFLYLLKNDLKNIFRPFQIVSTVWNYDFFNHLRFWFVNGLYDLFRMFTVNNLIVERINKNDWDSRFETIFSKINLKRCKTLFNFGVVKQFFERIL